MSRSDRQESVFSRRALLLGLGQGAAFTLLAGRLYQLQVMEGRRYQLLADDNRLSLRVEAPVRGRILDRNGVVLAENRQSYRALIQPQRAGDVRSTLALLTRIIPIKAELQDTLLAMKESGRPRSRILLSAELTYEQLCEINLLAPMLPGVETDVSYARVYPEGPQLAHVTGYIGAVERFALDDDPALRVPGARIGKSGIERGMERALRGSMGVTRVEVDAHGRTVRTIAETPAKTGDDVASTIDAGLQRRVMQLLSKERRASSVVMNVESGEILALASHPTFDAESVSGPISRTKWQSLLEAEHQPMLNRATAGLYPPGSTFKAVTALAALEAGVATPADRVVCTGSYSVGGRAFRCWKRHGHGSVDLQSAMAQSCDSYFYEMARRTGIARLSSMARRLGLAVSNVEGLDLETLGVIPDRDWKRFRLRDGWATGDTVLTGIGQGFVLTTPLQIATLAARIASGRAVVPRLHAGGQAPRAPDLGLAPGKLDAVRQSMVNAVHGRAATGSAARPSDGTRIAGKTGTSQVRSSARRPGEPSVLPFTHNNHALFMAYFPANAPRYAMSIVVEHGGSGGSVAAPLAGEIIDAVLAREKELAPAAPVERVSGPQCSGGQCHKEG